MKEAVFSNAVSRIRLGVHWHFDAFAGEEIMEKLKGSDGKDTNPQRPKGYEQLYACKADGSTKYIDVSAVDWFHTKGARGGDPEQWWYGGVPLGMLIADDIFSTGMKFVGSLKDLSADHPVASTAADV